MARNDARTQRFIVRFVTLVSAGVLLLLMGCSAMSSMGEAVGEVGKAVSDLTGGSSSKAKTDKAASSSTATSSDEASHDGGSSSAMCCVNGAYYSCPGAAEAAQCLGSPMSLGDCLMACNDSACENGCMDKHGPDPSKCSRDGSKDGECAK